MLQTPYPSRTIVPVQVFDTSIISRCPWISTLRKPRKDTCTPVPLELARFDSHRTPALLCSILISGSSLDDLLRQRKNRRHEHKVIHTMTITYEFDIPRSVPDQFKVPLETGRSIVIIGANGSGKTSWECISKIRLRLNRRNTG